MRSFHIIVNPAAGGGRAPELARPFIERLVDAGASVQVKTSPRVEAMDELVAAAVADDALCVVAGGDGMINSVVTPAVRHGATLGILPIGRGNDFSRQLGISRDKNALIDLLLHGEPQAVDLIDVGDRLVASSVYAGVDSLTSQLVNQRLWIPGFLQYAVAAVLALAQFPAADYRVTIDGETFEYQGFLAVAANSGYYGKGMHIAPQADPRDGMFDVVMLTAAHRARFILNLPRAYTGTHTALKQITVARGRQVTIEAAGVTAYADGELLRALPVTATIRPGALQVLSPAAPG